MGHGTFVSGLALYGDVAASIRRRRFVPVLRLFSGKVFKDDGTDQADFVERAVEEAVRYFRAEYGCRVFNLSYGDLHKVYDGRHLRGLAYTLDHLSRTLDVLFVVSSGNRMLNSLPSPLKDHYPAYLFGPENRISGSRHRPQRGDGGRTRAARRDGRRATPSDDRGDHPDRTAGPPVADHAMRAVGERCSQAGLRGARGKRRHGSVGECADARAGSGIAEQRLRKRLGLL